MLFQTGQQMGKIKSNSRMDTRDWLHILKKFRRTIWLQAIMYRTLQRLAVVLIISNNKNSTKTVGIIKDTEEGKNVINI